MCACEGGVTCPRCRADDSRYTETDADRETDRARTERLGGELNSGSDAVK